MTTKLEIKVKDRARGLRLKRHLETEHPSTSGNIKVETKTRKKVIVVRGNRSSVNKIIKAVPNFKASADKFTKL